MPELKNCRKCNRIFSYITGPPICPNCQKEEEEIFEKVSMYIREHQDVPLTVVSKELDVSYEKILKYVREGRLQIKEPDGSILTFCEKCGKEIPSGRFCKSCEAGLAKALESSKRELLGKVTAQESKPAGAGGGFRFIKDANKK
ncbi:MAG: MerR family transcriptional regulator [Clostridiales bacterium]|jgi:flagellar operon protein (TIGR03826 family)|nr:MerR family transcriptional regulator [Clostridiales bacterium]